MFRWVLLLSASAFAQIDISGFLAAPVGDFASTKGGMAETRFGVTVAAMKPVSGQLSVGGEGGVIMNTVDRDAFAQGLLDETGASTASASGGTYFNFPILLSLSFTAPIGRNNTLSLVGGVGYDFLSMMDMDLKLNGNKGTIAFDPSGAFAYDIGGTVGFGVFFIGAKYFGLGDHKIKAAISGSNGEATTHGNQEVSVVGILAGFRF